MRNEFGTPARSPPSVMIIVHTCFDSTTFAHPASCGRLASTSVRLAIWASSSSASPSKNHIGYTTLSQINTGSTRSAICSARSSLPPSSSYPLPSCTEVRAGLAYLILASQIFTCSSLFGSRISRLNSLPSTSSVGLSS